jgi:hypothetical protein
VRRKWGAGSKVARRDFLCRSVPPLVSRRLAPALVLCQLVAITVSAFLSVSFSQARYPKGNLTSSIGMGHAATVALSKAKMS